MVIVTGDLIGHEIIPGSLIAISNIACLVVSVGSCVADHILVFYMMDI